MIDWFRVVVDLERAGYTQDRIAAECLRSKGWVHGVKVLYAEPRHRDGEVLLSLWAQATGQPKTSAPQVQSAGNLC